MPLLSRKKELEVQNFISGILNNNCPELRALMDGPRLESRVNLTMVVLVIPLAGKKPQLDDGFTVVTKDFSCLGVSIVLDGPLNLEQLLVGFRWDGEMNSAKNRT